MTRRGELGPVSRESTAALIARQLRSAIMYGSLAPGSQLGEAELSAQLGVSRGPLREAMQRLVQEGLLRSERNRGLFVITLDANDVRDIYTARAAIERAAVSVILRRDRQVPVDRLAEVHRRMVEAAEQEDRAALSDADLAFHEALVAAADSPRLQRMHQTLLVESRMCITALEQTDRPLGEAVDEHGAILAALREGNRRKLDRVIEAHMDDALRRLAPEPDVEELSPSTAAPARRAAAKAKGRRTA